MQLVFEPNGGCRCVYAEHIELSQLGQLQIRRASHVEPDDTGHWMADLSPVNGPTLGPFRSRQQALQAELTWLEEHWLEHPA